ncbi:hypothetical protein [Saccharopolyspora sp. CA-218241]|uniref:hypothetical protein n=1 Tax=Saccharopolyspora sp. CA-218241 TaxID=3240027 RepID=UPI003D967C18
MSTLSRKLLAATLLTGAVTFATAVPALAAAPPAVHVLADDDDDDRAPTGGIEAGGGGTANDDDDDDRAPTGGVEAGGGGTAEDGGLLPLGLAGGAALVVGFAARKRFSGARG